MKRNRKLPVTSITQSMDAFGIQVEVNRNRKSMTGKKYFSKRRSYIHPTEASLERVREMCQGRLDAESSPDFTNGFAWVKTDFDRSIDPRTGEAQS